MDLQQDIPRLLGLELAPLLELTRTYQGAGWQCYLVGGALRDMLLGLKPQDFDFATDAPLEESRRLFKKVIPTGAKHGTVTILLQGKGYEVTRLRRDVETDGRHARVIFTHSLTEDQARRDLTINALALDLTSFALADSQGGWADLKAKRIRFVGCAAERIREDQLRALRYLRYLARFRPLGFAQDPQEMQEVVAVFDPSPLSMERILDEFQKIFAHPESDLEFLRGALPPLRLFRRFLGAEAETACLQALLTLRHPLPLVVFAAQAGANLQELRLPKNLIRLGKTLAQTAGDWADDYTLKTLLGQVPLPELPLASQAVEAIWQVPTLVRMQGFLARGEALHLADLSITPYELQTLGLKGRELGQMQQLLLRHLYLHPAANNPTQLKALARELAGKGFLP